MPRKVKEEEPARSGWREAGGILLAGLSILMFLSMMSYDPNDMSAIQMPPNNPPGNYIGPFGAWLSFLLFMTFGVAAYAVPFISGALSLFMIFRRRGRVWPKALWLAGLTVSLLCLVELNPEAWSERMNQLNLGGPGGAIGQIIGQWLFIGLMGRGGTMVISITLLLASIVFLSELKIGHVTNLSATGFSKLQTQLKIWRESRRTHRDQIEKEQKDLEKRRKRLEEVMTSQVRKPAKPARAEKPPRREKKKPVPRVQTPPEPSEEEEPVAAEKPVRTRKDPAPVPAADSIPPGLSSSASGDEFSIPPISILDDLPAGLKRGSDEDTAGVGQILEETLAEFGIEAQVTNVAVGPVVTRYELLPAAGIRVERIAGLSNNIALAMKAESIRVQAPVPGKGVVGIEVPNASTEAVYIREVVESDSWTNSKAALPLALGKDVSGHTLVGDLATMPHLLIAGATGAGKSVCMNSILAGLLLTRSPEELRLMLIDPKIVEFSGYNDMPHLVVPVITEAKKVSLGLRWAINEMEKRYKMFAKAGVRNIKGFNSRPKAEQTDMFGENEESGSSIPDKVPYIVIIVDELADLMLVAQAEIENSIARLAQLSRAVGIHMIIATQRPSVNVITGTIKANFPARIAFQTTQGNDSKTILDTVGAEKLLGKGDMLYMPPGVSKLTRAQGTLTTDQEINRIVQYIKQQGTPEFVTEVHDKIEGKTVDLPEVDSDDELLEPAIEVIRQTRRASTSSLQRRLRIGYTRAARLMDVLEEKGIIGPPNGSEPREILIDLDGEIPHNAVEEEEAEEKV